MSVIKNFIIGIITYNRYDYLDILLKDIHKQSVWPTAIYISDNGTGYKLKENYNIPIIIIKNAYNYGTCRGLNEIIKVNKNRDILFLCDDNYFMENTSLMNIIDKFNEEKNNNNIHLIWCNHWAAFIASKEWIECIGLFDEHIWPCYYEDSDMTERIRKLRSSNISHNCIGYKSIRIINNYEETDVIGNKRGTGEVLITPKYNDFKTRNLYYHNYKWKEKIVNTGDLHQNTFDTYISQNDIDIKEFETQYLKNQIKDLKINNEYNYIHSFVDEILNLKEINFESIVEYKTQRTYTSRLLLMLNPKQFFTYDDNFDLSHDFCYHFNYLLKNKTDIKIVNSILDLPKKCNLLVINKECDFNILNNIESDYLIIFNKNIVAINNYVLIKHCKGETTDMIIYKKYE